MPPWNLGVMVPVVCLWLYGATSCRKRCSAAIAVSTQTGLVTLRPCKKSMLLRQLVTGNNTYLFLLTMLCVLLVVGCGVNCLCVAGWIVDCNAHDWVPLRVAQWVIPWGEACLDRWR
jgi:hypothetical protein